MPLTNLSVNDISYRRHLPYEGRQRASEVALHASEVMLRISEVRQSRSEVFASEQLRRVFGTKTKNYVI